MKNRFGSEFGMGSGSQGEILSAAFELTSERQVLKGSTWAQLCRRAYLLGLCSRSTAKSSFKLKLYLQRQRTSLHREGSWRFWQARFSHLSKTLNKCLLLLCNCFFRCRFIPISTIFCGRRGEGWSGLPFPLKPVCLYGYELYSTTIWYVTNLRSLLADVHGHNYPVIKTNK